MVYIALHFQKMKVEKLVPFATSIKTTCGADTQIVIPPATLSLLGTQNAALNATVILRETNTSTTLTSTEGTQATAVMLTLEDIATQVEKQANAIANGNIEVATTIIQRIGFVIKKVGAAADRFFEVFKTAIAQVSIRVKADKTVNLYHWQWTLDEKTWNRTSDTTVASIIIFGLPSEETVFFQSAVTVKVKGIPKINAIAPALNWSDSISQLIP